MTKNDCLVQEAGCRVSRLCQAHIYFGRGPAWLHSQHYKLTCSTPYNSIHSNYFTFPGSEDRNEAVNRSNVFRWCYWYRDGRELVEYERGGRPKLTWIEVKIAAVAAHLLKNHHRITSRMMTETLNIPKTVVLRILKEDYCSWDFVVVVQQCTHSQSCKCLPISDPKKCCNPLSPPGTLQIYLRQTVFCSPSWKWS
jgi:hypothetical protein